MFTNLQTAANFCFFLSTLMTGWKGAQSTLAERERVKVWRSPALAGRETLAAQCIKDRHPPHAARAPCAGGTGGAEQRSQGSI